MQKIGFGKRIKSKIENLPPSGKYILKGASYGGCTGYALSTLYALPFGALLFLGMTLIEISITHSDWYFTVAAIGILLLGIWVGFFVLFVVPAYLYGIVSGSITALILYFFHERIDLTPMRAILITMAFWIPLGIVQAITGIRQFAEISIEPFFKWLLLYIPNMIFLLGMMFVGYKLWKYSTALEQTAEENCQ